jgi:hypothetical protein
LIRQNLIADASCSRRANVLANARGPHINMVVPMDIQDQVEGSESLLPPPHLRYEFDNNISKRPRT